MWSRNGRYSTSNDTGRFEHCAMPFWSSRLATKHHGQAKSEMTMSLTIRFDILRGGDGKVEWNSEGDKVREGMETGEVFKVTGEGEER